MTFGDVDHLNQQALESQDRIESAPRVTMQEPLDEPRHRYSVSDREAWEIANQHELQREMKW